MDVLLGFIIGYLIGTAGFVTAFWWHEIRGRRPAPGAGDARDQPPSRVAGGRDG